MRSAWRVFMETPQSEDQQTVKNVHAPWLHHQTGQWTLYSGIIKIANPLGKIGSVRNFKRPEQFRGREWWILGWLLKLGLRNIEIPLYQFPSTFIEIGPDACRGNGLWRTQVYIYLSVAVCGCRLLLFLCHAPRGFCLGTLVSHLLKKETIKF